MPAAPDSISISPAAAVAMADAPAALPSLAGVAVTLPAPLPLLTQREIVGVVAAIVAHVLVCVGLLERGGRIGAEGTKLEAIGVEIVTLAEVSAARTRPADALRSTTTGTLSHREGAAPGEVQSPSPDARVASATTEPDAAAPADLVVPDFKPPPDPPDQDATAPVIAPARSTGSVVEPVPELRRTVPEERPTLDNAVPAEALLATPEGGAPAAPQPAQRLAAVEPDAAVGRRDAYGQAVFDTLRSNPPAVVPGVSGTVTVEFTIGSDGGPAAVRIVASSGDRRMDRAAVAAVEGVRFPTPPPGLDVRDLVYRMPFTFRWNATRR